MKLRGFMTIVPSMLEAPSVIEDAAFLGANVLRWQLTNWAVSDLSRQEYKNWLNTQIETLKQSKQLLIDNNMKVIIDNHTPTSGVKTTLFGQKVHRCIAQRKHRKYFIEDWQLLAETFKDNETIIGYDLINEPSFSSNRKYQNLMQKTAEAIREIDPVTTIIVEPKLGIPKQLNNLEPLRNINNVWYSPHFYWTGVVTYQGVAAEFPIGRPYPGVYSGIKVDKDFLEEKMNPILKFKEKHNVEILIGEFSCARMSGYPNHNNAYNWLKDSIELFEKHGFHWCYHAWREAPVWSLEMNTNPADFTLFPTTDRLELFREAFQENL